jgi:DNA-directed RNA polymerase specialized sigma24 family protein
MTEPGLVEAHALSLHLLVLVDDVASDAVEVVEGSGDDSLGALDVSGLDAALMAIPPPQREVMLLRYRDDMSYGEIALVVGCPIGTRRGR